MKRIILLCMLVAVAVFGQTLVNYPTDVRGGPYASDAGPVGKTLPQLCTGAGSLPLAITQRWNALTTQTIPCLTIGAGGMIQPATSQVVTFSKFPNCPGTEQCFDVSLGGAGSILFPQTGPSLHSQVEWFGAVPQNTSGPLNGGAVNVLAFNAAQLALPHWPICAGGGSPPCGTNLTITTGQIKVGNTGINYAYPLNSTIHVSPFTTLSGDDVGAAYIVADRSGFTGSYLIDTINYNGAGQTYDVNFYTAIRNFNISTINSTATARIGGIDFGASLNSRLENNYLNVGGAPCLKINQDDGIIVQNNTCNVFPMAGDTTITGQCIVINQGNNIQYNNSILDSKCAYAGAYGSPPLEPGFLPSSDKYAFEIGSGVQGLTVTKVNFENFSTMFSIGIGSHDIFISNVNGYVDCLNISMPNCTVRNYCANLVEPNTWNIHLEGTAWGWKYAVCIGHHWPASTTYDTNQNFIIDTFGCVEKVTTGGTTSATEPTWPGASCSGTTSDGSVTWTAEGPVVNTCDPSSYGPNVTFDPQGFMVNCAIPTVARGSVNVGRLTLTGPFGQSGVNDPQQYPFIYDSNTFWQLPPAFTPTVIGKIIGADFNSAADQMIIVHFPPGYSKVVVTAVVGSNFSADLHTAQGGVYQSAGKTNCTIVPASQFWGTQASMTNNYYVNANVAGGTCANAGTSMAGNQYGKLPANVPDQTFFLSLTTPEGSPATGNITIYGYPVP